MNTLILATTLLLQTPVADAAGTVSDARIPAETVMRSAAAMPRAHRDSAFALPFGEDKVQHFLMSYGIASFAYGAARAAGIERGPALTGAMAGTLAAGAVKELADQRSGGDPSFGDFLADILGAAAAYLMLSQVR